MACPNQSKIDAITASGVGNNFEIGFNINFQWLGPQSRIQFPSQKVMLIENYSSHDSERFVRYCCSVIAAMAPPRRT